MNTLRMKAYELYVLCALALGVWAIAHPADDMCPAAAGAAIALGVVGINEAIQRRFRRPDPQPCKPPACYCGTCENCQHILRLDGVIHRTRTVDFDFPKP